MIAKETYRRLFDDLILDNEARIGNEMYIKDADMIFNWFYNQIKEQVQIETRSKEAALLQCHRLKDQNESALLEIIRNDRYKKLDFIYKLTETLNRPDVFGETYLKALRDVLFMFKDDHPEIKHSDLLEYTAQQKNKKNKSFTGGERFSTQTDHLTVVDPTKIIVKQPIMIKENEDGEK